MCPSCCQFLAVSACKATEVRYTSAREEYITNKLINLVLQYSDSFLPTNSFILQEDNELFSPHHTTLVSFDLRFEVSLLILELASLSVEFVYLLLGCSNTGQLLIKNCLSLLSRLGYFSQPDLLWHNTLVNLLVT